MATYPPPTETLQEFAPAVFSTNDTKLTIAEGKKYFLTFPTAQGTENLVSVNVAGDLTLTNGATFGTVYGFGATKPTSGTSIYNTAYGYQTGAGFSTTTATGGNSGFGAYALNSVTTSAENNTGIGYNALRGVSTGTKNTQVGMTTTALANNLTTGSQNTLIGHSASVSGTSVEQSTAIGYNAQATASNQVVLGTASETVGLYTITPLYTTVPSYSSTHIGYTLSATLTYPTTTTNNIVSNSIPAGTWLMVVCLAFNTGTGALQLSFKNNGATQGFIVKSTPTTATVDYYTGCVTFVVSTGSNTITLAPSTAHSVGTAAGNVGQAVKFVRIA